jgi:hypothetical protein
MLSEDSRQESHASRLAPLDPEAPSIPVTRCAARLDLVPPRQGVSLLVLTPS